MFPQTRLWIACDGKLVIIWLQYKDGLVPKIVFVWLVIAHEGTWLLFRSFVTYVGDRIHYSHPRRRVAYTLASSLVSSALRVDIAARSTICCVMPP